MKKGLLIVGHGSRSLDAQNTFKEIVKMVKCKASYEIVEGSHMEISEPNIPIVVEEMVGKGVNEILVVPYFLYSGIHIKEDIPQIIKTLEEKYNDVIFKMGEPIGEESLLADIIVKRAKEIE
ncbi:CbiX/SirB N-terminal domain-containing protein [Clostridium sp. D2Q-14]|uniref:sirohydrochlorin chelatase n=1 Tax=Anaeromonas gelatinilytica TaxID=2683194 RepID=UPI00193B0326|nr:CbiX/SirB N-terminal domain-containing protein [Anaeromonas gelatinilytica]MBS4535481.1 CbiX/SirB N-terminal domain-containing protein [Anaeromonas gelatinilytica]